MKKYILIEKSLFTAQQKAALKGYGNHAGKYLQDSEQSMRDDVNFRNDNKIYLVLSWEETTGKPPGILPRYSENGNNEKVNKIMTLEEIRNFIDQNVEPVDPANEG